MRAKKTKTLFGCIMVLLSVAAATEAAYFVFNKKGNIRSGPGTQYRVIGQLAKETIAQIPGTFTDYDGEWIAIDSKALYDKKTSAQKVVYTKWVHRSLGVVIKGDIDEVERYFAVQDSGWPQDIQNLVLAGKIELGMTTHMVFYAWGKPDQVDEASETQGTAQQWVYKNRGTKEYLLYFKDGILIRMRN